MTDAELIARLRKADEYEPLGHDGWEAADRIEALTAKLAECLERSALLEARLGKAVKLIDLGVELARWDLNPKLRDDMIYFTTELKG